MSDLYSDAFEFDVHPVHRINVTLPDPKAVTMTSFDGNTYRVRSLGFHVGQDSVWITGHRQLKDYTYSKALSRDVIGNLSDTPAEALVAVALHFLQAG